MVPNVPEMRDLLYLAAVYERYGHDQDAAACIARAIHMMTPDPSYDEGDDLRALAHFGDRLCERLARGRGGVRQDSCRLSSFQASRSAGPAMGPPPPALWGSASTAPWPLCPTSGRSGFSQTEPAGCQLRVSPDQRSGRAALASS